MTSPITKDGEYTTRSGLPVRIYATDEETKSRVHGAIYAEDRWIPCTWSSNGEYRMGREHEHNLIPKPKVRKLDVWLNIDQDGYKKMFGTRDNADRESNADRIACIHIQRDVVEGEGLE